MVQTYGSYLKVMSTKAMFTGSSIEKRSYATHATRTPMEVAGLMSMVRPHSKRLNSNY